MSDVKVHARRSGDQILFRVWNGKAYETEELTENELRTRIVVEAVRRATTDALITSDFLIFRATSQGFSEWQNGVRRTLDSPWEGEKG